MVPPVQVLAAVRIRDPVPVLVRVPAPSRTPPQVETKAPVLKVPPEDPRVIPRRELTPAVVVSVPPFSVRIPAGLPKAASVPMATVPARMARPPFQVFAPVRVSVPVPSLISWPVPETTPDQVELLPPVLRVPPPDCTESPRALLKALERRSDPPSKVTEPAAAPSRESAPTDSVPDRTIVPPVNVLAPPRTRVPRPSLVRDPAPLITPLNVREVAASLTSMIPPPAPSEKRREEESVAPAKRKRPAPWIVVASAPPPRPLAVLALATS